MSETPSTGAPGCPFSAAAPDRAAGPEHRRSFGLWRNPAVQQEIESLDAKRDCQRIVYLLTAYEFPADMQRSTELALFHTYGSQTVSALLDRTKQFSKHGQKRYDDTRLLIAQYIESGWETDKGRRSIEQMNHIHSFYRIENEDFLFVLWTFLDFPKRWLQDYGWRAMTAHECEAWFHYWIEIGRRMNLTDIPATWAEFDDFVAEYESRKLKYSVANERVAQATIDIMAAWLPKPLRFAVKPSVSALVPDRLRPAVGLTDPPGWLSALTHGVLKARAVFKRFVPYERYPTLLAHGVNRTYPGHCYRIEELGPAFAHRRAGQAANGKAPDGSPGALHALDDDVPGVAGVATPVTAQRD